MTGSERREQLIDIGRGLFAEKGFDATSIEEVAQRAEVSKPIVYEHFGGKEGLYAVVVDREVREVLGRITDALEGGHPRGMLEQAARAFLTYVEEQPDGFRILVRDTPAVGESGTFASVIEEIAARVEYVFAAEFKARGYNTKLAPLYSRALVGMVALVGQWWRSEGKPKRDVVVTHLVNLAWNGLKDLDPRPSLKGKQKRAK